ncbi:MAG TPA: TonB family protein, partial [Woeseiaceae bacterium]|nr:TonB family protein [Woeseiaceae bacterium]
MRQLAFAAAVAAAAAAVPAFGQALFQTDVDASDVRAVPIERPAPNFPGGVRTGQEGWVRVNFVVTPDGRATDPIVVEAAGGAPFEHAVREMLDRWRFEPPGAHEIGNNVIDAYFEIDRGRDAASANFIRRSRRIVRHVYDEEAGPAREQLDAAVELGGWNLYESTMLNLMAGRVAALEGDDFGKLEHYRRAFAMNVRNSVSGEDRRDLLARIFEVEYAKSQYSAAAATAAALAAEPGG